MKLLFSIITSPDKYTGKHAAHGAHDHGKHGADKHDAHDHGKHKH